MGKSNGLRHVGKQFISVVVAGITFLVVWWSDLPLKSQIIILAVVTFIIEVCAYSFRPVVRWVSPIIARSVARCIGIGVFEWAKHAASGEDSVWNWLYDQILVAQARYAFSISCIAFDYEEGKLYCLLVDRGFPENKDQRTLVWPGGRFRGLGHGIDEELKQKIRKETGCDISLMRVPQSLLNAGRISESLATYDAGGNQENELYIPPLFIMRQNRQQKNGIHGHIDLIYLAEVINKNDRKPMIRLINVDDIENDSQYPDDLLWPDTRECIKRAANLFNNIRGDGDFPDEA